MQIEILAPQLANQIAAGEVVERPSSVVKELVENSLDAGATEVEVHIEQGGAGLILIRDNGSGISKDDLPLALCRHATSKIKSMDDLLSILSFGFRGEALASISSVSRLTLTSKTEAQSEAWQVYAEGREMNAVIKPAAHPVGTSVEVRHLFYNTPARRKFLRTEKTEFNHIDEVMKRIALVRYDVAFVLSHQGKKIRDYRVSKHQDPLILRTERIGAVCGQRFLSHAKQISWTHFDLSIQAWIWPTLGSETDLHFTKGVQYCYVNGRVVRDKVLLHAIKQAFQSFYPDLSPSDDKLAYVIYFDLPPEQVDVNVHPAKHEVRFHQTRLIHDFIFQAVVQSLSNQAQSLTFDRAVESDVLLDPHQMSTSQNILDTNRAAAGKNQFATQEEVLESEKFFQENKSQAKRFDDTEAPLYRGERHLLATENTQDDLISNSAIFERKTQPFDVATYLAHAQSIDSHVKAELPQKNQSRQTHSSFSKQANTLYRTLVTPLVDEEPLLSEESHGEEISSEQIGYYHNTFGKALHILNHDSLLLVRENGQKKDQAILLDLYQASIALKSQQLRHVIAQKQSQALLLPLTLKLTHEEWTTYVDHESIILGAMISSRKTDKNNTLEIDGVPAPLRHCDLAKLFAQLLQFLAKIPLECLAGEEAKEERIDIIPFFAHYLVEHTKEGASRHWSLAQAIALVSEIELINPGVGAIYHAEFVRELS